MLNVYYHPNSLLHEMGVDHLEAPIRVKVIRKALEESGLPLKFIRANDATEEQILQVHSRDVLNLLLKSTDGRKINITADTSTNMFTYQAALSAAGAGIQVVQSISKNHGFAMIRPPGHHATSNASMGFCFFNNIAIAAHELSKTTNKIVILDIDNHYGNGTADIFLNNPDILYISAHADPDFAYPGTGYAETVGNNMGTGKTVNIPLPWKVCDTDFLVAFDEIIYPIVEQFKPDAILVSLGLDALETDPYGHLGLTSDGFYELGRRIAKMNKEFTNKKVGTFLEGGYDYDNIGHATVAFFEGLLKPNGPTRVEAELTPSFSYSLRKIKAIQRNYWFGI